jgi:hypothetical protein
VKRLGLKQATFEAPGDLLDAVGEVLELAVEAQLFADVREKGSADDAVEDLEVQAERLRHSSHEERRHTLLLLASAAVAALAAVNNEQLDEVLTSPLVVDEGAGA